MEQKDTKVFMSVIVPVYNVEAYLRRCVDSILRQTFGDFELLLVDDGSTDGSGSICDEYAAVDSRVRVFHKPNGGVSSARNMGLDNARGEWITFSDSDDWMQEDNLRNFADHVDADCVMQGFISTWGSQYHQVVPPAGYYSGESLIEAVLALKDAILEGSLVNKLFRRKLIESHHLRLEMGLSVYEDLIYCWRYLVLCSTLRMLPMAQYEYVENQDSLTHTVHSFREMALGCMSMEEIAAGLRTKALKDAFEYKYFNYDLDVVRQAYNEKVKTSDRLALIRRLKGKIQTNSMLRSRRMNTRSNDVLLRLLRVLSTRTADVAFRALFGLRRKLAHAK